MCLRFPNTAGKRRPEQLIITLYDSVARAHKTRGLLGLGQVFQSTMHIFFTARPTSVFDPSGRQRVPILCFLIAHEYENLYSFFSIRMSLE